MFSNLLEIPLLLVDQADLQGALTAAIEKDFFQPVSAFSKDLHTAQQLHTSTVQGAKNASDPAAYELVLLRYYGILSDIETRFPDNLVTYDWYVTLGYSPQSHATSSWSGAKAHLLYQLGAVYSRQAHLESRHSDEGTRNACNYFKQACGCFQELAQSAVFEKATVETLQCLMLAQAQEVFWQKAVSGNSAKNSLVARLSMQVAQTYREALEHANESKDIILEWINYMQVKHLHFKAAAFYRASVQSLDNYEYGQQVAFLKQASRVCAEAQKYKSYVNEAVLEDLSGLTCSVNETLRSAEKDNDFVYLKPVPEFKDLPEIRAISMVEPSTPESLPATGDTFKALLPFSIVQIGQAFTERQDDYIAQNIKEPLAALSRMFSKFLASESLPSALDTLQRTEGLPDTLVDQSREILSIGGTKLIEQSMDDISVLACDCAQLVAKCEERIEMEKKEDEQMRCREGTARWNRVPSGEASADFIARLAKMRNYLNLGHDSDILIGQSYQNIKPALEILCGGKEALLRNTPKAEYLKMDDELARCVAELRNLLLEGHDMDSKRERFSSSLEHKFRDHSVLSAVISAAKQNIKAYQDANGRIDPRKFEPIYEAHIKILASDLDYVQKQKSQQLKLEAQISDANARFRAAKQSVSEPRNEARFKTLQKFHDAYVQYLELVENLNRASAFYSEFLKKGSLVLEEIDAYLYNRRQEARELGLLIRNQENLEGVENSMRANLAAPTGQRGRNKDMWFGQ